MESDSVLISELLSLEKSLLKPGAKSTQVLSKLLADDFIEIGSSGKVYRKHEIIGTLTQQPTSSITLMDFRIRILSPEIVLVTYKAIKTDKAPVQNEYSLRSSIWKSVNGEWRISFHQGTLTQSF